MFIIKSIIVVCVLAIAKSTVVPDERCHFTDHECQSHMYDALLKQTAGGIPSMNIPRADPMHLNNVVASLPNSFKLTMIEGTVTGLKNCVTDNVKIHLEEPFRISLNLTCSIKINATDEVEVPKSLMEELGIEDIDDNVFSLSFKATLTMDTYHLYLDVPFDFKWKNGEIYAQVYPIDINHDAHDLALAKFTIEDLDEGNKVNGQIIVNYIQEKAIELNLMLTITEKFGEFFQAAVEGLLINPAKHFFKEDISKIYKARLQNK